MRVDLPSRRYALLIEQLAARLEKRRGWQTTVAELLGVDRSFVSRVHNGARAAISEETIQKAIDTFKIDRRFFEQPLDGDPWFGDYIESWQDRPQKPGVLRDRPKKMTKEQAEAFVSLRMGERRNATLDELIERGFRIIVEDKLGRLSQAQLDEECAALAGAVIDLPLFVAAQAIVGNGLSRIQRAQWTGLMLGELARLADSRGGDKWWQDPQSAIESKPEDAGTK